MDKTTGLDYTAISLGELLSSQNDTIRRNAISILKEYQRSNGAIIVPLVDCYCYDCSELARVPAYPVPLRCPKCHNPVIYQDNGSI